MNKQKLKEYRDRLRKQPVLGDLCVDDMIILLDALLEEPKDKAKSE